MVRHHFLAALIACVALATPVLASDRSPIDYDKIDRTIGKRAET